MGPIPSSLRTHKGNLLPRTSLAQAVAHRAEQVQGLLITRRKLALTYKRTQDERYRIALEHVDRELTAHRIDIPSIQKSQSRSPRPTPGAGNERSPID